MVTISDWCDVAWEYILDSTPMMASPIEYRDVLWAALHDGETPTAKGKGGKGKAASQAQTDQMLAMLEQAKVLRGETPDLDS
jgi:hypothetical protein